MKICSNCKACFGDAETKCRFCGGVLVREPVAPTKKDKSTVDTTQQMVKCPVCGFVHPAGTKTCRFCGANCKTSTKADKTDKAAAPIKIVDSKTVDESAKDAGDKDASVAPTKADETSTKADKTDK